MNTKTRIIAAAERLFAEKGFTQTSMREITTLAQVNLASVNYHFGSKKNLIQAVLQRYFDLFMPRLDAALEAIGDNNGQTTENVLEVCVQPLQSLDEVRPNGTAVFLLLLGRGYNESQGHLRKFIQTQYGTTLDLLIKRIHMSVPHINAETLFWRLHFALGALVFSMAAQAALTEIVEADFHHDTSTIDMLHQLLPFVAQGISSKNVSL